MNENDITNNSTIKQQIQINQTKTNKHKTKIPDWLVIIGDEDDTIGVASKCLDSIRWDDVVDEDDIVDDETAWFIFDVVEMWSLIDDWFNPTVETYSHGSLFATIVVDFNQINVN